MSRDPGARVRLSALLYKEWHELKRSKTLIGTVVAAPSMLVLMSISMVFTATATDIPAEDAAEIGKLLGDRAALYTDPNDAFAIYMGEMGLMMLLMLPAIVPSVLAANTIVREKLSRSLEALLVTPVRTWELVLSKLLFCTAMGVLPTYVGAGIFYGVSATQVSPTAFAALASPAWLVAVGLLGPLLGVLAIGLGIIVSARVTDVQTAQQLSGLITLPIVGIMVVQAAGIATLSTSSALLLAAALLCIDLVAVAMSVSLFERETVLTRWKS